RAFCAGADVDRFIEMLGDADRSADYARRCSQLYAHLDGMSKPVVAALNGLTLGGGLELASRCHELVAIQNAKLQFPEIGLGIAPGSGALAVPFRRWPDCAQTFADMILEAQPMTVQQALDNGVVSAVADSHGELLQLAIQRVHALEGVEPAARDAGVSLEGG